jgi:hypothetical protein
MDQQGRDVRFVPKADIGTGTRVSLSTQQLRQLDDVRRDPACLILRKQLGCRAPARLVPRNRVVIQFEIR